MENAAKEKEAMSLVVEFHEACGQSVATRPPLQVSQDLIRLRMRLIDEEVKEVRHELKKLLRPESAEETLSILRLLLKELADLRYVLEGTAVSLGLPINEAFMEVHRSNMTKLWPDGKARHFPGGKVKKGPDYEEADMVKLVPGFVDV